MVQSLKMSTELRLIKLRWLAVAAMASAALLSRSLVGSFDLAIRLLVLAVLVASVNAALLWGSKLDKGSARNALTISPFAQLSFDLACWSVFCFLSGGATNPLITVFLPLVAMGAMVLERLQAWLLGSMAILAYSYLWYFYQPLSIQDAQVATQLHLFGMWLVFVVSDIMVIWFILQVTRALRARDAELAATREQAIRNDWVVSIGSLAAGAAHELSTPLGTLNLLIDELLEEYTETGSGSLRSDLELMRRQVESCKQSLHQLTQRSEENSYRQVVAPWLKRLGDSWQVMNPAASITMEIPAALNGYEVIGDVSLERALVNALDNALNAGAIKVVLSASLDQQQLLLTIEDDGSGISPEAVAAFEAGQPVASAKGMGVGLLLARAAIERHGGSFEITAMADRGVQGNRGTRVKIMLPVIVSPENPA